MIVHFCMRRKNAVEVDICDRTLQFYLPFSLAKYNCRGNEFVREGIFIRYPCVNFLRASGKAF